MRKRTDESSLYVFYSRIIYQVNSRVPGIIFESCVDASISCRFINDDIV